MRTTSRRITLPEKMLWLMGLGASVSLFYRVQDHYLSKPPTAVVIPYEFFNLEGREEQPRTAYYSTRGEQIILSDYKEETRSEEAHAKMENSLVKLLNFK